MERRRTDRAFAVALCDVPDAVAAALEAAAEPTVRCAAETAPGCVLEHGATVVLLGLPDAGEAALARLARLRRDPDVATVPVVVVLPDAADAAPLVGGADDVLRAGASAAEVVLRVRAAQRTAALRGLLATQTEELTRLAYTDGLTGLPNRRYVAGRLTAAISSARRHRRPLAVVVGDLDGFKAVNDDRGHEAGDEVLRRVAEAFGTVLREEDVAGRWGGDEFVVVLPDTGRSAATRVASRLRAAVAAATGDVTLSVGVADWRGEEASELLDRADALLLDAKRAGRETARFSRSSHPHLR